MRRNQRTIRFAKQLFRFCLVEGLLDAGRARGGVRRILASGHRDRFAIVKRFLRLVEFDIARHSAEVETAEPLPDEVRLNLQGGLARHYGPGLTIAFIENSELIGGIRIRVGSDVYDGSVRGRLAALAARF
jgi:F-type H+-transporting ATPase subunit delta